MAVFTQQLVEFLVITFVFGILLNVAVQILLAIAFEPGIRVHLFVSAVIFVVVMIIAALFVWLLPVVRDLSQPSATPSATPTTAMPLVVTGTSEPPIPTISTTVPAVTLTGQPTTSMETSTVATLIATSTQTATTWPAATPTASVTAMPTATPTAMATATPTRGPLSSRGALLVQGNLYAADGDRGWIPIEISSSQPYVKSVTVAEGDSGNAYVGTTKGVFVSEDGGATWRSISDGLPAGAINALVWRVVGGARELLAGTELGVYRLTGGRWEPLGNELRDKWVGAMVADPGGRTVYAATYDYITGEGRVYRLPEGQAAWVSFTPTIPDFLMMTLLYDAQSEQPRLYAGTVNGQVALLGETGVVRQVTVAPDGKKLTALAIAAGGLYAGTDGGLFGMSRTLAGPVTAANGVPAVPVGGLWATNSMTLYAVTDGGVYRSVDGGTTWSATLTAP
jgi:hypothetical protein